MTGGSDAPPGTGISTTATAVDVAAGSSGAGVGAGSRRGEAAPGRWRAPCSCAEGFACGGGASPGGSTPNIVSPSPDSSGGRATSSGLRAAGFTRGIGSGSGSGAGLRCAAARGSGRRCSARGVATRSDASGGRVSGSK